MLKGRAHKFCGQSIWVKDQTFKKKNKDICNKLKVDEPAQVFLKSNILYICKIMRERQVDQIIDKLVVNKRTGSKIYIKEPHKPSSKSSLIKHIKIYNALSFEVKSAKIASIKRRFKKENVEVH